jgi:hypothetical protein
MESCGFSLQINVATWERQIKVFDTYVASKTKIAADQERVFIQAIGKRKRQLEDPAANLFDAQQCVAQDIAKETTASGLRIRLQAAECSQQASSDDSRGPTGQHRLYGTVDGHWSSLGVGLFASSKENLAKYKPEFVKVLKTLRHLCPIEFLPLKTEAKAELAGQDNRSGDPCHWHWSGAWFLGTNANSRFKRGKASGGQTHLKAQRA